MLLEYIVGLIGLRTVSIIFDLFWQVPIVWAIFKISFQKVTGHAMPRVFPVVAIDIAVDVMNNLPGALNRAWRERGGDAIFLKPEPPDRKTPVPVDGGPLSLTLVVVACLLGGCSAAQGASALANAAALWGAVTNAREAVCSPKLEPILEAIERRLDAGPFVPLDAAVDAEAGVLP